MPEPRAGASPDPRRPPDEARDPTERYGPLEVARWWKDDGRALILYSLGGAEDSEVDGRPAP